ncbi:hypothetical protein FB451DRAFT_1180525 [Mycena latifolia]|nr:hypothetical protein FB451DRAFT_1180525 [Mycena latifolia]
MSERCKMVACKDTPVHPLGGSEGDWKFHLSFLETYPVHILLFQQYLNPSSARPRMRQATQFGEGNSYSSCMKSACGDVHGSKPGDLARVSKLGFQISRVWEGFPTRGLLRHIGNNWCDARGHTHSVSSPHTVLHSATVIPHPSSTNPRTLVPPGRSYFVMPTHRAPKLWPLLEMVSCFPFHRFPFCCLPNSLLSAVGCNMYRTTNKPRCTGSPSCDADDAEAYKAMVLPCSPDIACGLWKQCLIDMKQRQKYVWDVDRVPIPWVEFILDEWEWNSATPIIRVRVPSLMAERMGPEPSRMGVDITTIPHQICD